MAVQDDLRRLTQLDSIFLGWSINSFGPNVNSAITSWYKGRLQQANDGTWIFRSISSDGDIVGYQLGFPGPTWSSSETPSTGITVVIQITQSIAGQPAVLVGFVFLQQQLPQGLTN
jgi:hypothetical protein